MTGGHYQPGFVAGRTNDHNERRSRRMRAGKPSRQDLAVMIAAYEHNTVRPPITLPRISIQQQDAE
jgi:hypothetical protein